MLNVSVKKIQTSQINKEEVLRYASCKNASSNIMNILDECIKFSSSAFSYNVCYCELPYIPNNNENHIGSYTFNSKNLASFLSDCDKVVLFASTLGIEFDRLINKYSKISTVYALFLQAIGTERIENICDSFCNLLCEEKAKEHKFITSRYSAGYGDLSLTYQKDIFSLLDCEKNLGLTLNNSLIMSPTKSVTGIIGISNKPKHQKTKCINCTNHNCQFRSK